MSAKKIGELLQKGRQRRLLAYAGATLAFVVAVAVFSVASWNRERAQHERHLETTAELGAQAIDTYLGAIEGALALLADTLQREGLGPRTNATLAAFKARFPEFSAISVTAMDGEIIHTSQAVLPGRANLNIGKDQAFIDSIAALQQGASMVVSRPLYGPVSKLWLSSLRYGVRDGAGRLRYTLHAGLPQERTLAFWKNAPLPPGARMGVTRDDAYVIARYPAVATLPDDAYAKPSTGLVSDYLLAGGRATKGVLRGASRLSQENVIVSFRRLERYPLTFFVADREANLRADWLMSVLPTYTVLLILFGGGLLMIGVIGSRHEVLQREREARLAILEERAQREHAINQELEALSARQSATNAELQQATRLLSESNVRLEATNAELEAFMYSVSHDLRAPIRAIDGFSALLQTELALPADGEANKLLSRIRGNAARMADLLNDLLDLSRYSTQDMRKEIIDTRAEVDAVIADLGHDSARVRFEIGALPPASGDRTLLRQVWINLIGNALKYSANVPEPVIRIGFDDGAYFVADNGTGFDMAYVGKLFKLFSRLHRESEFPGTGIGLAIVKRIVERHGGHISASGVPGGGARFSFALSA